jgi:hypothetical protein
VYIKFLTTNYFVTRCLLVWVYLIAAILITLQGFSQTDSNLVLTFDFNNQTYNEKSNLTKLNAVGVSLVEDRFYNEASAVCLNGHINSYLSLGTSKLLKPKTGSISLWVNIHRRIYAGRGGHFNPLFMLKNGPQEDFNNAYSIAYAPAGVFVAVSSKDSLEEAQVSSVNQVKFARWYHLVITSDTNYFTFYIDGKLQGRSMKKFETTFLESDSLVIGHSASYKNSRFTNGVFDDIQIFHRVLNEKEVRDLYNAPNPNKAKVIWQTILKWVGVFASIVVAAFLIVWRRQRNLKRASEKLDLESKLHEMEIRTLKSQMNPHFIFNSLNSIQQFIMTGENAKAELYLSKFSRLMRDLLESNTKESILLSEEVDILKGYIEMEMLRFDNSFSYSIQLDTKLNQQQVKLPHMMIQPFVENAIWHGLLKKQGNGKIGVHFEYINNFTLRCTVDDNGIGRKASANHENTFKKKSLALSIVEQRLSLIRQTLKLDCKVEIMDKTDLQGLAAGTRIIIILPILN